MISVKKASATFSRKQVLTTKVYHCHIDKYFTKDVLMRNRMCNANKGVNCETETIYVANVGFIL